MAPWVVVAIAVMALVALNAAGVSALVEGMSMPADTLLAKAKTDPMAAFETWKLQHHVIYATTAAENAAFSNFLTRLAMVLKHNADPKATYWQAMTHFSDKALGAVSAAAFTNIPTVGTSSAANSFGHLPSVSTATKSAGEAGRHTASCPATMDWRTAGVVTPVKDQGQCGSCWTFASTGAMEGAYALATGKLVSLSEQELADCSCAGTMASRNCISHGCEGGTYQNAFAYAVKKGIAAEAAYPYQATDMTCNSNLAASPLFYLTGYTSVGTNEAALLAAVCNQPVAVSLEADTPGFQQYAGGIYTGDSNCGANIDHTVLAVGYGTASTGQQYWLLKNQWATSWGEAGYMRMLRGSNVCGIVTEAPMYPTVAAGTKASSPPPPPPSTARASPPPPPPPPPPTQRSIASPPPPPSSSGVCADMYSNCPTWKSQGYCAPQWVVNGYNVATQACPYTCGNCGCADLYTQCAAWKLAGYCAPQWSVNGQNVLSTACPATCGSCTSYGK